MTKNYPVKPNFLLLAAMCSAVAACAHLGCIIFGAPWYRFFGAGEQMARMAEAGELYPTVLTAAIVLVLFVWSLYALSGALIIRRLPLLRTALIVIAFIYLARAFSFALLMPMFPDNSDLFWIVSSSICFFVGMFYLLGLVQNWSRLSN